MPSRATKAIGRQTFSPGLEPRRATPSGEIRTCRSPHQLATSPITTVAARMPSIPNQGSSISAGSTGTACIVRFPHSGSVAKYAAVPAAQPMMAWIRASINDMRVTSPAESPSRRSAARRRSRPRAPSTAAEPARPASDGMSRAQATTASTAYIVRRTSKVGSSASASASSPVGFAARWKNIRVPPATVSASAELTA